MSKFLTFQQIVNTMVAEIDTDFVEYFKSVPKSQLIELHFSTGRAIRNEFGLWDENNPLTMLNYQPQLEDGVDVNLKHPDAVSMDIIEAVWQHFNSGK